MGRAFDRVWHHARSGVVFEESETLSASLARARPHWSVYQGDAVRALAGGFAKDRPFDVVDVDVEGRALAMLDALFRPGRTFAPVVQVVVRDAGRLKAANTKGIALARVTQIIGRHGGRLADVYLQAMRECIEAFGAARGYQLTFFDGWHCGNRNALSDYWATLKKT